MLAPGTAAAARLPVIALRRESGAESAAIVAGSKTMIDFVLQRLVWHQGSCGSEWDMPRFAGMAQMQVVKPVRCCSDAAR